MALQDEGATPEVTSTESDQPMSMDDTIRDTLRSLQTPEEPAAEMVADTPAGAVEEPEAAAARLRDAQGKFAAAPPVVGAEPAAEVPAEPAAPAVEPAPNTWKKEAAAQWASLPPDVRAEIQRREQDMHRGIEQYKTAANFGHSIERVIAPYAQTMQKLGVTPDQAISEFMAADHTLRFGSPQEKSAYLAQLAHNYGVDLGQTAEAHANFNPQQHALHIENKQLQAQLQNYQQTQQLQQEQALNSEIESFAADPSHSHFEAVRGHMSALLQAGQAKDLADAYEQAVYANPTTRAAVLQQQAAAQREEAAKKAQAAKAAASINHRPRPAMPVAQPIGSMDDTIRNEFRRLTGT